MTAPLLELFTAAHRARLTLTRDGTKLVISGPRSNAELAAALIARKGDVLPLLPVWTGDAPRLDWRREPILSDFRPCALCHRSTLLVEPYDGRPCHKTCAESVIRWGTLPTAKKRAVA